MDKTQRRELKSRAATLCDDVERFVRSDNGVQVKDENVWIDPQGFAEAREKYDELAQIKAVFDMETVKGQFFSRYDMNPDSDSVALAAAGAGGQEAKSLGQAFTDSAEFKRMIDAGDVNMSSPFKVNQADIPSGRPILTNPEQKDVYATMAPATYTRQMGSIQFDPMVPRGYRRNRVRDLFPVATTSSNLIDFYQVVGYAATNQGAKSVPDRNVGNTAFAAKPHTNLTFRPNQAPVRTIAHWEQAHRNVLEDVPQLQSTINNELLYGLQLEEDRQILNGSGVNSELLGIFNMPDIQTYASPEGELFSDAVRFAMVQALLAYYEPTGVCLHPRDWARIETQKGNTGASGDGQYMLVTNVSVGASAQLWRLPVVESPAMTEGQFLTGAFGTGVQLYDRQQANVRTSEHHSTTFVENAVTILCEERLALAGKRPESLVAGTFAVEGT